MDDKYRRDDPQAWVTRRAWAEAVGRDPSSKVPVHTRESWADAFPDDYPDGRSPKVYCLPIDPSGTNDPSSEADLQERVESLEQWHRELQAALAELGRGLRNQAEESRVSDKAISALTDLLQERTEQRAHLADRLIAFSMDDPSES